MPTEEFDKNYAHTQIARSRSIIRQFVKYFYLNNVLKDVYGPSIDFGCGAGQLLSKLPPDSIGLEVNPNLVKLLSASGLNVDLYTPDIDQLKFSGLEQNKYKTFIMSHVLEHFDNADLVLKSILKSCNRLGVERVILVLPCELGYQSDPTHKTFISKQYISDNNLMDVEGYSVTSMSHFPIDTDLLSKVYTFHELKIVYQKKQ